MRYYLTKRSNAIEMKYWFVQLTTRWVHNHTSETELTGTGFKNYKHKQFDVGLSYLDSLSAVVTKSCRSCSTRVANTDQWWFHSPTDSWRLRTTRRSAYGRKRRKSADNLHKEIEHKLDAVDCPLNSHSTRKTSPDGFNNRSPIIEFILRLLKSKCKIRYKTNWNTHFEIILYSLLRDKFGCGKSAHASRFYEIPNAT